MLPAENVLRFESELDQRSSDQLAVREEAGALIVVFLQAGRFGGLGFARAHLLEVSLVRDHAPHEEPLEELVNRALLRCSTRGGSR